METIKFQIEEKKAKRFRKRAMGSYGYSKGAVSKAANNAIDLWLDRTDGKKSTLNAKDIRGIVSGLEGSSLEIEKKSMKMFGRE
ncbi:MAG: hypothetical protein NUV67_02305 [archaeon]|nr:hypothetical protein [archaeon]